MKEIKNNLDSLTALRFFAAFLVVGFHFYSFDENLNFLNHLFSKGHLGIEFFFVLSGFVIGLRYLPQDKINIRKFFKKRLIRISPSYYLALFLSIPLMLKSVHELDIHKIILLITSTLFYLQSFIPIEFLSKHWNHPAWSVSTEIFFYLIFPFFGFHMIKNNKSEISFIISLFFIILVWFINLNLRIENFTFINIPIFRYLEFIFGAILAKMFLENKHFYLNHKISLLIIFSIIATIFLLKTPAIIYSDANPVMILLFGLFIFSLASVEIKHGFKVPKTIVVFGEASYSLYILQVPLKFFFQQFYSKILNFSSAGTLYSISLGIYIIIASVLINRFLEERIIKKLNLLSFNKIESN